MASGNLDRTVSVSEGGEIGVLAESLETMRAQLKDSLETVRRWGEELELKVGDRTAELNARNRQLAAVSAILAAANETHDLEGMLRRCLDVVLEQTAMDAAAVRLLDDGSGRPAEVVAAAAWSDFPCRLHGAHLFRAAGESATRSRPRRGRPAPSRLRGRRRLDRDPPAPRPERRPRRPHARPPGRPAPDAGGAARPDGDLRPDRRRRRQHPPRRRAPERWRPGTRCSGCAAS